MSSLAELLSRAGQREIQPLGFGRPVSLPDRAPDVLVIGRTRPEELSGLNLTEAALDSLIIELDDQTWELGESDLEALGDRPWGIRTASLTGELAEQAKAAGVDFAVFEAAGTDGSVLTDCCLGKFLSIDIDLDDRMLHAVSSLPLDGISLAVPDDMIPLSVESILRLHSAVASGAHTLLWADFDPRALTGGDLEAMRGIGISAVVLPAANVEEIRHLRHAIRELPEPQAVADERVAIVPQHGTAAAPDEFD